MGKSKKITKEGFKILLLSSLHLLIFEIICIILEIISYIGLKPTGGENGTGFLTLYEYKLNLYFTNFACILFLIVFTFFYFKYLKKDLKKLFNVSWIFIILYILIFLLLGYAGFIAFILVSLFRLGLFSTTINDPVILYWIMAIYIIGLVIIDVIREIYLKIKK